MKIAVKCNFLLDCALLLKRFEKRNMRWGDTGRLIEYNLRQAKFSRHASQTTFVIDTDKPNEVTRMSLKEARNLGAEIREFDDFFNKNFGKK